MKNLESIYEYVIVFWFSVVSFITIISLVDMLPKFVDKYLYGIEIVLILAITTFIFILSLMFVWFYYIFKFSNFKK